MLAIRFIPELPEEFGESMRMRHVRERPAIVERLNSTVRCAFCDVELSIDRPATVAFTRDDKQRRLYLRQPPGEINTSREGCP